VGSGRLSLNERRFYEIEAAKQDWSVRELKRPFNSSLQLVRVAPPGAGP